MDLVVEPFSSYLVSSKRGLLASVVIKTKSCTHSLYTQDISAFSSTAGREKPSDSITLSGEGTTPAPCARLNRTTASLDALRFEASAHHQAGSCTLKKGRGVMLMGEFQKEMSVMTPVE